MAGAVGEGGAVSENARNTIAVNKWLDYALSVNQIVYVLSVNRIDCVLNANRIVYVLKMFFTQKFLGK